MVLKRLKSQEGWLSLIGMLLAMAIIAFWAMKYLQPKQQPASLKSIDAQTAGVAKEVNIDTSSHLSVLQSTKKSISAIEERNKNRGDEIMKEIEEMQQY